MSTEGRVELGMDVRDHVGDEMMCAGVSYVRNCTVSEAEAMLFCLNYAYRQGSETWKL